MYFVICHVKGKRDNDKNGYFKTIVDTGATNSLMHTSVVDKFGIKYKPLKLRLKTATGVDEDAIKGIAQQKFYLVTPEGNSLLVCANYLVTSKLNGMESILEAKFLFGKDEIAGISKNSIMFEVDNVKTTATIWPEIDCRDKVENLNFTNFLDVRCKS